MVHFLRTTPTRMGSAACVVALATFLAAPAAAAERLSDNDVKQLIERVDNERDRFEDQLDGKLKSSILRGPNGEVNVSRYLDDLQDNVDRLKERFTSQYAASAEVTTVLRQGSDIQRYMSTQPPTLDGSSEWIRLSGTLGVLATTYGTTFPIPEGQQARRMNDKELSTSIDGLSKNVDRYKKELDSSLKADTTVDKATRDTAVKAADDMKKDAERLASTVGDGKPSAGEAQALFQRAVAVRAGSAGRTLSPAAQAAWGNVESGLSSLGTAFGLPPRP